jgi:hypothetical protein
VDAVQDLEDCRFASAVLAEQGMDLAGADFDTDVVERADPAEGLRHSSEADRNLAGRGFFGGDRHRPNILCERADGRQRGDWATPLRGGGGFRRLLHAFHDLVGRRLVVDFLPGVEERVAGDRCSRQRDISRRRLADQGIGGERRTP